ncbi:putative NFACT protein [Plasmopara halstedii]
MKRNSAWSNQVIAGAYWVHADQVSKTAPTGELPVGLAILFRIDESCVNHRSRQVEESALLTSDGVDEEDRKKGGKVVYSAKISTEATMLMTDKCTVILPPSLNEKVIDNFEKNERRDEDAAYKQHTEREGKKRLSAKERRDLKKGKTLDDIKDNSVKQERGAENSIAMTVQMKNVRVKKGKMKKNTLIRMTKIVAYVWKHWKSVAVDESNDDAETEASENYIRQQREKNFLTSLKLKQKIFYAFTREPRPNDIVLFLMCAPYTSLTKVKYKVKLTSGGRKKVKAAKQAMKYFASNLKEEKNANRPLSDAHDNCQMASYSVSTCVAFRQMIS